MPIYLIRTDIRFARSANTCISSSSEYKFTYLPVEQISGLFSTLGSSETVIIALWPSISPLNVPLRTSKKSQNDFGLNVFPHILPCGVDCNLLGQNINNKHVSHAKAIMETGYKQR